MKQLPKLLFAYRGRIVKAFAAIATVSLAFAPAAGHSQDFPTKPVRITTPVPVASGPQGVIYLLADKLSKKGVQPVIVENRSGGNGFIAIAAFKSGATNGHELIQLDNVHLSAYPHLFKKLPYDPKGDLDPILPLLKTYFFFTVATNSKYKTINDLIADAKANPGKLNHGSWSVGNPAHLGAALFESVTGTEMQHVPFKETSQLYASVANGELQFALGTNATSGALQRAGKIRFLAVAAPRRIQAFLDVQTVTEQGGPAGFEVSGWTAIAAPRGLPKSVTDKIQRDVAEALAAADIKEKYVMFGYESFPQTREQFNLYIGTESTRFADIIKKATASLDR